MQKIMFLIPPSEGKALGGTLWPEILSFHFEKPEKIVKHASEKDLKCKEKRFEEAQKLNHLCIKNEVTQVIPATARYNGVMYNAIDYQGMEMNARNIFDTHFLICSGMYGLLHPQDQIANYKLPIETKELSHFWKEKITQKLNESDAEIIIDLLPWSYKKMIDWKKLNKKVIVIDFFELKDGKKKKMTHGVKTVKGDWIKKLCEADFTEFERMIQEKISKGETRLEVLQ